MLDEPWRSRMPAPTADEDAMLELTAAPREAGSRLSCQIALDASLDGLVARLPSRQY
jgi:2Fe-2S ferredoxin